MPVDVNHDPKTRYLQIRISEAERKLIRAVAKQRGLRPSQLIRTLLHEEAARLNGKKK